jgi:hypothetical protein
MPVRLGLVKPGAVPDLRLALLEVVSSDAEVQVDPVALPLDLVDLALAVLLTARLEGQQLGVSRKGLQHR